MYNYRKHLLHVDSKVKEAMARLNELALDAILFLVDDNDRLIGSLTDGDIRRGFLKDYDFETPLKEFIQPNPRYVQKYKYDIKELIEYRDKQFKIIPVLDHSGRIVQVINFRILKSYLPVDAVVMAGGKGERLRPLTENTPKPLLKVGDRPIIEHNLGRLMAYGIDDYWVSIRYLAEQLEEYFTSSLYADVNVSLIKETTPLGTIGSISLMEGNTHNDILLTNSDILTNLNYEDFYLKYLDSGADLSVVTIPYSVNIPYAVLETSNGHVISFKEKPTYTYYSNGGIYLFKKELLSYIPNDQAFDATDFMEVLISNGKKVHSYPLHGYWLDIGKKQDFEQAQLDISSIAL